MSIAQPDAKPSISIKTMAITGYATGFNRTAVQNRIKPFELLGFSSGTRNDRGRAAAATLLLAGRLEHALNPAAVGFDARGARGHVHGQTIAAQHILALGQHHIALHGNEIGPGIEHRSFA